MVSTLASTLGALAGYLNWQSAYHRAATIAGTDSVAAARETAKAILSYNADTVETDLKDGTPSTGSKADGWFPDSSRCSFPAADTFPLALRLAQAGPIIGGLRLSGE